MRPRWKVGEVQKYTLVKEREQTSPGIPAVKAAATTPIEIKVVSTGDEGYVISWTHGETTVKDMPVQGGDLMAEISRQAKGLQYLIELDSDGNVSGLKNWEEISDKMIKSTDLILNALAKSRPPRPGDDKVREQLVATLKDRTALTTVALAVPMTFFNLLGGTYQVGEAIEMESTLPNVLGGPPFPARQTLVLKSFDSTTKIGRLTWTQTIDPVKGPQVLLDMARTMARRAGKPEPTTMPAMKLNVQDTAEYTVDFRSGWTIALTHTRVGEFGGRSRIDRFTIQRSDPPGAPATRPK